MEIPTPSLESIGKFFGGLGIAVVGGWAFLKKIGLIGNREDMEEVAPEPIRLRRAEDAGIKVALETALGIMDARIKAIEARSVEDRTFMLNQITESETRLSRQIEDTREAVDRHNQGINERLDFIITQVKK